MKAEGRIMKATIVRVHRRGRRAVGGRLAAFGIAVWLMAES
jgi:hypothetical protein